MAALRVCKRESWMWLDLVEMEMSLYLESWLHFSDAESREVKFLAAETVLCKYLECSARLTKHIEQLWMPTAIGDSSSTSWSCAVCAQAISLSSHCRFKMCSVGKGHVLASNDYLHERMSFLTILNQWKSEFLYIITQSLHADSEMSPLKTHIKFPSNKTFPFLGKGCGSWEIWSWGFFIREPIKWFLTHWTWRRRGKKLRGVLKSLIISCCWKMALYSLRMTYSKLSYSLFNLPACLLIYLRDRYTIHSQD